MPLRPGDSVGPYSVLDKLGEGGMGEVWKARDTRLGRVVALKCLPTERIADPSRRQRFFREAQAASALNHPNIITVHDWAEDNGGSYVLVMEFVPGKTLDRLIGANGLPLRDTLNYAIQIASALSAAHAAGIIHSDIKPANVMVGDQGRLKVLDFGLARLTEHGNLSPDETTMTARIVTEEGTVAGTAPYMSPEQAEGKKLDARSDIFSFGAVLYEMVTGRRAFAGDSRASQMAAVLKCEPQPPSQIAASVPRELERIISRCLRKDLDRRSQSMAEIALELEEIKQDSESGVQPAGAVRSKARSAWIWPATIAAIAAAGLSVWIAARGPAHQASPYRLRQITTGGGNSPAVSPDGKLIVYGSNRGGQPDLWIQPLAGGEPVRLTNTPSPEFMPQFSPDGGLIYFRRAGGIYAIPPIGGGERSIVSIAEISAFALSNDGKEIAYGAPDPNLPYLERRLWVLPASGGAARMLNVPAMWIARLFWSPGGKHLLAGVPERTTSVDNAPMQWRLIPVAGGPARQVEGLGGLRASERARFLLPQAWLPDGRVIFSAVGDNWHIWSVRIGEDGRAGPPVQLTNGTGEFPGQPSADGRVIPFTNGAGVLTLYQLKLGSGGLDAPEEPQRLLQSDGDSFFPVTTADGKKMVYVSTRLGNPDIWIRDLETGADSAVVATPARETRGVISADGSRLAFQRSSGGIAKTFWMPLPQGAETKICDDCRSVLGWTPDAKGVVVSTGKPEQMIVHEIATGKLLPTAVHPTKEIHDMSFSPDGRWLVFKVVESGTEHHVYVSPYVPGRATTPVEWTRISGDGFSFRPFWSPDGNMLYYFNRERRVLLARHLDPSTKVPKGDPVTVKTFGPNLLLPQPALVGYGLAGNRLILPLGEGRVDVWVAEQER
jgi:eukaryotic-like serine/threonine-protein kinase